MSKNVRLGDLLSRVDGYATECDITRAEAVRRLVTSGLSHILITGSGR